MPQLQSLQQEAGSQRLERHPKPTRRSLLAAEDQAARSRPRDSEPQGVPSPPGASPSKGKELRGPERFFYDKSSFTGVHKNGGPSTSDGHGNSKYTDLSEMTRTNLGTKAMPLR